MISLFPLLVDGVGLWLSVFLAVGIGRGISCVAVGVRHVSLHLGNYLGPFPSGRLLPVYSGIFPCCDFLSALLFLGA